MHAGDALWHLYGLADILHRRGQQGIASMINERADVLSAQLKVPAPGLTELTQISSALECFIVNEEPTGGVGYASEQQAAPKANSAYAAPDLVAAATKLTDEMNGSGQFDWANIVTSITAQLEKDEPFITPKQCRALKNIANGKDFGDEGTFWDWFANEYPGNADIIDAAARKA